MENAKKVLDIRSWITILIVEIITVPIVVLIFRNIESRSLAGIIAGSVFILSAGWIFYKILRSAVWYRWITPYVLAIHFFGVSLPLFLTRAFNFEITADQLNVWGFPLPQVHALSEKVYLALIIVTARDLIQCYLRKRQTLKVE